MPCEIERKFLVTQTLPSILSHYPDYSVCHIRQRYLPNTGDWTIRLRHNEMSDRHGDEYWLTMKSKISALSCIEIEEEVTKAFHDDVAEQCGPVLEKTRYAFRHGDHVWEVDHFTQPEFNGLVVAEIELKSEDEAFEEPLWLGEDVSHDKQYKNAKLVKKLGEVP